MHNSNYVRSFNETYPDEKYRELVKDLSKKPSENDNSYRGSSKFWMKRLEEYIYKNVREYPYDGIIENAIEAVDRENSTHLNADGVGRDEIGGRISKIDPAALMKYLKNDDGSYELIKIISEKTNPKGNGKHKPRENLSFASKFCTYASLYIFDKKEYKEKYRDGYSIYDGILEDAVQVYAKQFDVECEFKNKDNKVDKYKSYQKTIDDIRDKAKDDFKISRNGFDHLLWYYYKAHPEDLKK